MHVKINDELHELTGNLTISELLTQLQLNGKRIAVERNGEIIPKSQHALTQLSAADKLEIVVAVGGG